MKELSKYNLCTLIFLLIFSCGSNSSTLNFVINLDESNERGIEVFNIEEEILYKVDKNHKTLNIPIENEVILNLKHNDSHSYIYVQEGVDLVIDSISMELKLLGVVNSPSIENQSLIEFEKILKQQRRTFKHSEIAKYHQDTFLLKLNEKYDPLYQFLQELDENSMVSNYFISVLKTRLETIKGNDLITYRTWNSYFNQSETQINSDFYREADRIDITDPNLLVFDEGRYFVHAWHAKDISFQNFENIGVFFDSIYSNVKSAYPKSLVADYSTYRAILDQINYGNGIDPAIVKIDAFKATVSNTCLIRKMDQAVKPWLDLQIGLEAPNFIAKTTQGNEVSLSQLKGKKTLIDVWATWCGPCIAEMPSLKKLESEMGDKVNFVSISIDELTDKERWLAFVKEKELTGLQLIAQGDFSSDLAIRYNITSIPRFILINEQGKIISINALRASDPELRKLLVN